MKYAMIILLVGFCACTISGADDTAIREQAALRHLDIDQQVRYKMHENTARAMAMGAETNDFYGIVEVVTRYNSEADLEALNDLVSILDRHPKARVWPLRELPVNADTLPGFISWAKQGEVIAVIKLAAISKDNDIEPSILQSIHEALIEQSSLPEDINDADGLFIAQSARISLRELQQNGILPANEESKISQVFCTAKPSAQGNTI